MPRLAHCRLGGGFWRRGAALGQSATLAAAKKEWKQPTAGPRLIAAIRKLGQLLCHPRPPGLTQAGIGS